AAARCSDRPLPCARRLADRCAVTTVRSDRRAKRGEAGAPSNSDPRGAPTHAPGLSQQPLASPGRLCNVGNPDLKRVRALEGAGVGQSWAQIWAQTKSRENFGVGNLLETMVGRDGIEPPTPGFSVLFSRSWKCA